MITNRITPITEGLKRDVDMTIKIKKTTVLNFRGQDPITSTIEVEVLKLFKFICSHPGCDFKFHTKK